MKRERWEEVDRLYHAALERDPPSRASFLDEACAGDDELRREVALLLASDEQAGSFLAAPAVEIAARKLAAEPLPEFQTGAQPDPQAPRRIGAYQLLGPLGRGGMGEVNLALDTRLGRKVAIKLLPIEFTADAGRVRRFEQEARAASALNHPNIITIHEIGEAPKEDGNRRYIVTEYVEGETLRQWMAGSPQHRINTPEAIDIAAQIAAALSAAHGAGITHRDIKPENVMVRRDGIVKVLDFGLAKLTEPASPVASFLVDTQASTLVKNSTEAGVVMGTPRYMSPEQVRGEKVDARTDIFSLGVMLYEMIAGRPPFAGATTSDLIAAILKDDPPPLSDQAPGTPPELQKIISKALCKDRVERYQSANEMLVDLKELKQRLELETKLGEMGFEAQASGGTLRRSDQSTEAAASNLGRRIGRYQVLSLLGEGGMGEVYLAEDTKLGRKVALKLLPAEFTADADRLRRFEQEARTASSLNHSNIITIFEVGQEGSSYYIATEFIDGQTLRQQMKSGRIDLSLALNVAAQIAAALSAAHEAGIVHRDIKPENVMVRRDGYVKVLDFGLAKLIEPPEPAPTSVVNSQAPTLVKAASTKSGILMGTPRYMSPEQARGERMDARADIFSLGSALYEMITGQAPFIGATSSDVIAAILWDDPAPLTHHAPEAPHELEKIVSRALRKDREGRYQTAEELFNDLNLLKQKMRTMDSSNPNAHDNSLNTHPKPSSRSIRNLVALAVLLFAVIVVLIYPQIHQITEQLQRGHQIETPSPAQGVTSFPRLTENLSQGVTLEMAQLSGGEYEMGSNVGEGEDDERPRHKVKVDPFAIGVYEITQAQWKAIMGSNDNPSHFTGNDNLPVDNVSWALAQDFIKALQRKTGQQDYRLPTEKEWEYAARAGSTGKWSFDDGKGELSDYAWYSRNAASRTQPVGKKAPNKWRLFDMQGNVMELCQDWYDEDAYKPERRNPPLRKYHVLRGGCIVCAESECRVSFRDYDESGPGKHIGFRVARTVMLSEGRKPLR